MDLVVGSGVNWWMCGMYECGCLNKPLWYGCQQFSFIKTLAMHALYYLSTAITIFSLKCIQVDLYDLNGLVWLVVLFVYFKGEHVWPCNKTKNCNEYTKEF